MDGFSIKNSTHLTNGGASFLDQRSMKIDDGLDQIKGSVIPETTTSKNSDKSFAATLSDAIKGVNEMQKASDKASQDLATGKTDNVADVMIAAEKADIALRVMVQVRNKIIDAYNEVMKMQV
jgi:flagellar hook-basal body complex protein FliE